MTKRRVKTKRKRKSPTARSAAMFDDLPELEQARKLWARNKLIEAATLFDHAARRHPSNIRALTDASRALGSLYQYERAEALLDRVLEIGGKSAEALHLAGQSFHLMRRHDRAIACLRSALELKPGLPDAHLELAILLERQNDLESTAEHCDARLKLMPGDTEALYLQARVLRRRGEFDRSEQILSQTAGDEDTYWLTRARCFAELAKLYDQQGDFGRAWTSIVAGKRLLGHHSAKDRAHRDRLLPALQRTAEQVEGADLERWREIAASLPPRTPKPYLLTGLPRSGTTLLAKILGAHDRIIAADEFDLFPRIHYPMLLSRTEPEDMSMSFLNDVTSEHIQTVRNSHQLLFGAALPESTATDVLIDKNPSLLPLIAPYLRVFASETLLVVLRDPRDVLVSCLMAYLPLNDFSVDFVTVEGAVARIETDINCWLSIREKLPPDAWLEVRYENLVRDWQAETRSVLHRLGLEWSNEIANYAAADNATPVYSPSYVEVAQPIYADAIGRWENYEEPLAAYLPRLNELVRLLNG